MIIVLAAALSAIPVLGTIITMASFAMMIYIWWKICERLGFPGWWAIMQIIFPTLESLAAFMYNGFIKGEF